MLILGADPVRHILDGAEDAVLQAVRQAYVLHAQGKTVVPHSAFLRFPADDRNRIIALPAYLETQRPVAGMKWVSSFPTNVAAGLERASAAIVLNSMHTGMPEALLEGSTISARRTAASAAIAAATITSDFSETGVSLIGCGVINFEVLRFLRTALAGLDKVSLFDTDGTRSAAFAGRSAARWPDLKVAVAERVEDALAAHKLVSLATTATVPHLGVEFCQPGTLALHLSLRDFTPEAVLSSVNIVDDAAHVLRASTSVHLAEQKMGHHDFIVAALGDILVAGGQHRRDENRLTIFSPFGLGILDLAVADLVRRGAERLGTGTHLADFLPADAHR